MSLARLGHSGGGAPTGQERTKGLYDSSQGQKGTDGKTVGGPGIGNSESGQGPSKNTTNMPATKGSLTGEKVQKKSPAGISKFADVLEPGGQCNP